MSADPNGSETMERERAIAAAKDRSAELRLDRLKVDAAPQALTVGEAFARYLHRERGGAPKSRKGRQKHLRARDRWEGWLGKETPWNRIYRGGAAPQVVPRGRGELREEFAQECERAGIPAPRPEHRFSDRNWRFD